MLGGPEVTGENVMTKFSRRNYNRRKRVDGKWVSGWIERGTIECFIIVVSERSKCCLML